MISQLASDATAPRAHHDGNADDGFGNPEHGGEHMMDVFWRPTASHACRPLTLDWLPS